MAAPDLYAPAPVGIDPAALSRFDALCSRMGLIAEGVNAFTDPGLREKAYYELTNIINPPESDVEEAGEPQWGDAPTSAIHIGSIANWIAEHAPTGWRDAVAPRESTADAAIAMLACGAEAWTDLLLVKRALIDHGGFTAEQVDGDLPALVRELASDAPISPEVEELAARLRAQAEPGETAVQAALRLMRELRLDKVDDREQQ
jgi:hypothetical protein